MPATPDTPSTGDSGAAEVPPFEAILTELEGLVARLEAGNLPLDESLRLFERGMGLSRQGTALLDAAERRVELLVRGPDGAPRAEPFEPPQNNS